MTANMVTLGFLHIGYITEMVWGRFAEKLEETTSDRRWKPSCGKDENVKYLQFNGVFTYQKLNLVLVRDISNPTTWA